MGTTLNWATDHIDNGLKIPQTVQPWRSMNPVRLSARRINNNGVMLGRGYLPIGPEVIPGDTGENNEYANASENWNTDADFNGDFVVNYADYKIFKAHYGLAAPFE